MQEKPEQTYTVTEACDVLDVTRQTLYQWIEKGLIQATRRMGKPYTIAQSEIDRALKPLP